MNHCLRCAAEPWVKESGITLPVACRCSVSSPIEEAGTFLLLAIDPDAGQAIGLQLDLDLQRIGLRLAAGLLLQPLHARQDAEQVLDVMAGLMRDDIGGGEFAGAARTAAKLGLDLA